MQPASIAPIANKVKSPLSARYRMRYAFRVSQCNSYLEGHLTEWVEQNNGLLNTVTN